MAITPALSIDKLVKKKFNTVDMKEFQPLLGYPEIRNLWEIYGSGGSGKSTLAVRLMKFFASLKIKCAYNSIEMKSSKSLQDVLIRENVLAYKSHCTVWEGYTVEDMETVLSQKRSAQIIFIDSIQALRMKQYAHNRLTPFQFSDFTAKYPKKLFIVISQEKSGEPLGALAKDIYYNADNCILVKDMVATPHKSRSGGTDAYEIRKFN